MATEAQREFNELMRDKGHRTRHPEDDDSDEDNTDAQSFLNISDSDQDSNRTLSPPPAATTNHPEDDNPGAPSTSRTTIPLGRRGANTGPKGVIADAQHFRDSKRLHRVSKGSHMGILPPRGAAKSLELGPTFTEKVDEGVEEADGLNWLEDAEEEEDDGDFMRKWRAARLREMQSTAAAGAGARGGGSTAAHPSRVHAGRKQAWSGLTHVDGIGYLDAIDGSPRNTVVAVYIFDDESEVSAILEEPLRDLASRHPEVRFVKLHFQDAEMEPAGVPALLAYRGGEKFAGLVPLIQEFSDEDELCASTLELALKRHGILR